MVVSCSWIGEDREWNNPWDSGGTRRSSPPVFTTVPADTIIAVNDTLQMVAVALCENADVSGYRWSFDGGTTFSAPGSGIYRRSWGTSEAGTHRIYVQSENEWGMVSTASGFTVTVRSYPPFIENKIADSSVSQRAVVTRTFSAEDSNGPIAMYFWGSGESGWDDSAVADNSGPVTASFEKKDGGPLQVRWAARDDDGLMALDTFMLHFNRGPDSVWLTKPAAATAAPYLSFDLLKNIGRIVCSFKARDPDALDTIMYTFFLGTTDTDTAAFYRGRDTSVVVEKIGVSTTYHWKLSAHDLFGDSSRASGEFVTSPPPPPPEGMVLIHSAGTYFQMGQSGFDSSEAPIHTAGFSYHFWIDTTEVTNGSFTEIMGMTPAAAADKLPVVNISWFDATLYCNARSKSEDKDTAYSYQSRTGVPGQKCVLSGLTLRPEADGYRLPTEAEWEYACRIDSLTLFFWGNDNLAASTYAWTRENSDDTVHAVAAKKPNRLGLYDMAGNVWEWCNDWFDPRYYSSAPPLDPPGPQTGYERVIRGGSWKNSIYFAQAGTRSRMTPQTGTNTLGFRTVLMMK
jgi:formylglycine-generating enzyme